MAAPAVRFYTSPEQSITVKVLFDDKNRRFKLPLKDLEAQVFPQKLRDLLGVPADVNVIFERYSDSAGSYILLDDSNTAVYKQLYRAAKAKLKLRIRASTLTLPVLPSAGSTAAQANDQEPARHNYLETVLSSPIPPVAHTETLPSSGANPNQKENYPLENPLRQMTLPVGQPRYRDFDMEQDCKYRFPVISHASHDGMFCIDCNNCNRSIANEHYHCSICEGGDYDLCPQCVYAGASCRETGHWLIKRGVVNGVVTNSTTETIPSRSSLTVQDNKSAPVGKSESVPEPVTEMAVNAMPSRDHSQTTASAKEQVICNGCCLDMEEDNLMRCNVCEDYDLCLPCFLNRKHGHHPAHTFDLRNSAFSNRPTSLPIPILKFRHAAICDGCEKCIFGVRHKCLSCPDWDYCSECAVDAEQNHPGHRFVPIYEALGDPKRDFTIHYGVTCDGPQCEDKPQGYITGVRYKCAVCHDVDFCANCEASPLNSHNRSHPLIKFKTPVRDVTVSTVNEDGRDGAVILGDKIRTGTHSTMPGPMNPESKLPPMKQVPVEVGTGQAEETLEKTGAAPVVQPSSFQAPSFNEDPSAQYFAYFVRDAVHDGTKLSPNTTFRQTWTLYNPGPSAWPVGSSVRFVGGDTMFNVDAAHPSSVDSIRSAMETNKLTAPLEVGQSADFSVTLRTPGREGAAISYWRLKLPNGHAIGHRLWCDLQVSSSVSLKDIPTETVEAEKTDAPEIISSGMIFPKLEKESPESSTHEAAAGVQHAPAPTLSNASDGDVMEDLESLTLDEASTDAGFLTDEEYDVLDASDQEFQEAKQSIH